MDNSLLRGMSDGDRYAARIAALQASGARNGMIESMAMRQAFGPMEMQLQPPPSPLQQWILINSGNADNALPVGSCVKICHLTQAELARYNGLVGTIVSKHDVTNDDGTSDVLFDIRCPILPNIVDSPLMRKDKEHYAVKDSDGAKAEIPKNRRQVAPMYGLSMFEAEKDDDPRLPPFVFLTRLPSEKFEQFGEQQPQSTGSQFNVPKLKNPLISTTYLEYGDGYQTSSLESKSNRSLSVSFSSGRTTCLLQWISANLGATRVGWNANHDVHSKCTCDDKPNGNKPDERCPCIWRRHGSLCCTCVQPCVRCRHGSKWCACSHAWRISNREEYVLLEFSEGTEFTLMAKNSPPEHILLH